MLYTNIAHSTRHIPIHHCLNRLDDNRIIDSQLNDHSRKRMEHNGRISYQQLMGDIDIDRFFRRIVDFRHIRILKKKYLNLIYTKITY